MQAGPMRHWITITAQPATQDALGQPIAGAATDLLSCWSRITAVTGKEIYALGAGFTSQVTHKIVLRNPGLTIGDGMTVLYGTRTFRVQAASDPDELGRELDLMVLEQTK